MLEYFILKICEVHGLKKPLGAAQGRVNPYIE